MKGNEIYKRMKYSEALSLPGHLEVCIRTEHENYTLQEALALVWFLIDGNRGVDEIHKSLIHLMDKETVKIATQELLRLKLIKKIKISAR